jgi:glycerophosphoryl diester phosphodiesterase
MRLRPVRRRWVIAGVLLALLAVVGAVWGWPEFQSYTGAAPPPQFDEPVHLDAALMHDYPRVLGIAHNAGNNLTTTRTAERNGADVIEIDVISARGHLVAGREQSLWPSLARLIFRGPTLAQAWDAAEGRAIKLDLKQDDPSFLNQVATFVAARTQSQQASQARSQQVMFSSPDPQALRYLHTRLPGATLLLTLTNSQAVAQLRADPTLQRAIGGVSAAQSLVTSSLVQWLHGMNLIVVAWTVTDGSQLNDLIRLGVDGITTPNLAILRALS